MQDILTLERAGRCPEQIMAPYPVEVINVEAMTTDQLVTIPNFTMATDVACTPAITLAADALLKLGPLSS
jgi:hypothetical protein